jgi:hypothetical protein
MVQFQNFEIETPAEINKLKFKTEMSCITIIKLEFKNKSHYYKIKS